MAGPPTPGEAPPCVARAFLGLGSNLGDRLANLRAAMVLLAADPGVEVEAVSGVYETEPVGGPSQGDYLNAVAALRTTRSPRELLELCLAVELALGRERGERSAPRVIDLDLLLYDEANVGEPGLCVPHPRIRERAFVLVPLAEIDPEARFPDGSTAAQALSDLGGVKGVFPRGHLLE